MSFLIVIAALAVGAVCGYFVGHARGFDEGWDEFETIHNSPDFHR